MSVTIPKQAGFSMVTVVFLLVVLGGAVAYLIKMTGAQQRAATLSLLESRAMALAESGLQMMKHADATTLQTCRQTGLNYTLTPDTGFAGFTLQIQYQYQGVYPYKPGLSVMDVQSEAQIIPKDTRFTARRVVWAKIRVPL